MESWEGCAYTALIVFGFLIRDGKVLIVRRANDPYRGERTVPGGRKQRGESLRQALAREIKEETGCVVKGAEYAGTLHAVVEGDEMEYLSVYFVCRNFNGEPHGSDEGEVEWMDVDESLTAPDMHPIYRLLMPRIIGGDYPFDGTMLVEKGAPPVYDIAGPVPRAL